jgi:putative NADH-flavin reductase
MAAKVLVLGGSGLVGRHLLERLQRLGADVTVPTRQRVAARTLWPLPCVDLVVADVTQPGVLARLLPGHDAVVNLVAACTAARRSSSSCVELPRQLTAACAASGVRRVLHVSALGAAPDAPSRYQRSKAAGEAALQEAAAAGAIDLTVLRPSVIYGADDRLLNLLPACSATCPWCPSAVPARAFSRCGCATWPARWSAACRRRPPSARPTSSAGPRWSRCASWCGRPASGPACAKGAGGPCWACRRRWRGCRRC